ncbi:AI-2E family transporter [Novosphingobium sp.]|uniref:AI-2E family transporter n=1 Tax=Novosphingobium sp. TaxID=1874826 RepID=UPI002732D145|nr:AI-2E family transporter [Novosphingobium sp.]MDP3908121.1 AI-2E family transporter [Novosphingobium sp.]
MAESEQVGPTDISDPVLRQEAKRAAVWIGLTVLVALTIFLAQPLLVIFGGMVFAAMVDGGARLLGRVAPLPRGIRVTIVLLAGVAFLVWTAMFAGRQIAAEAAALPAIVETQALRSISWLQSHGFAINASNIQTIAEKALGGVGELTSAVGGVLGGLTTAFLILVMGIYFAAEPQLYRRGVAWMLPVQEREHFAETTTVMGKTLRRLMFGRLIGMFVEGIATWAMLAIYGVPMAGLLGLLTGLLAFLPNIGAPISGLLMVIVGFSGGVEMGLYCVIVYVVVQTVDGNVIVPMVAKRTADLAPALVLGAQLIMGVLFGIIGLMLADPLVAMIKVALERQSLRNTPAES